MNEYSRFSLLEAILRDSGCCLMSELSSMTRDRREKLAGHIENDIPEDIPTLQDYNEALHYLLCAGPEKTKKEARRRLIEGLRNA